MSEWVIIGIILFLLAVLPNLFDEQIKSLLIKLKLSKKPIIRHEKVTLKSGKEFLIIFNDDEDYFINVSVSYNELDVFSYSTYDGKMNKILKWSLKYSDWDSNIEVNDKEELIDYIIKHA